MSGPVERWSEDWHRRLRELLATLKDRPPAERSEIRRRLGENDPIAFAIIYLGRHLTGRETGGRVTFAEAHYDWARLALEWRTPVSEPMEARDVFVAPRSLGKTTWWYLIIPLWASAYGYVRFCAAFAQSSSQAEGHLQTLRSELDSNPLLREDFPQLCAPAKRRSSGSTVADRQSMIHTASGVTIAARGLDSAVLGLKVGEVRPDLLVIDDGEPDEAQYSPYLAKKRLGTITDAIFALNIYARVVMTGTVTMPGSIVHQMVKHARGEVDETNEWVGDEKIRVHHHRAILPNDDGSERSIWPEKWPLSWLQSRRHTREYQKNYDNDPAAVDGGYWQSGDIRYGTLGALATRWILQLDPAVTTKGSSDWTGVTVVACRPPGKPVLGPDGRPLAVQPRPEGLPEWMDPLESQCEIVYAGQVKLAGERLRAEVLRLLAMHQRIKAVRVEVNQGGETWQTVLHDLPVRLLTHTASLSKEARFASALTRWHEGRVIHRERFPVLEDQLTGFPRTQWDDVADSAVAGVQFFLPTEVRRQVRSRSSAYT